MGPKPSLIYCTIAKDTTSRSKRSGLRLYGKASFVIMPDVGDAINSNIGAIKVKWYDTILLLIGTILAAADPITDILTLREFYLKDHKTWFGVGLVFLILPSLSMSQFYYRFWRRGTLTNEESDDVKCIALIPDLTLGWNPLALAYMRFRTFILCFKNFKKLWQENLEDDCNKKIQHQLFPDLASASFQASLESAPQFIIQLYATVVQQEQVTTIQITSLCVSFLSLAWESAIADVWRFSNVLALGEAGEILQGKFIPKVVFFISQLFHLSSRLFAITFFTVGFKWWIIAVLILHSIVMTFVRVYAARTAQMPRGLENNCHNLTMLCVFYWIRDDENSNVKVDKIMTLISNILFVIENVTMICVFYVKEESHQWYSVPVTVGVCLYSLISCLMRMAISRYLLK